MSVLNHPKYKGTTYNMLFHTIDKLKAQIDPSMGDLYLNDRDRERIKVAIEQLEHVRESIQTKHDLFEQGYYDEYYRPIKD